MLSLPYCYILYLNNDQLKRYYAELTVLNPAFNFPCNKVAAKQEFTVSQADVQEWRVADGSVSYV